MTDADRSIMILDGGILIVDGAIAISEDCCCGSTECWQTNAGNPRFVTIGVFGISSVGANCQEAEQINGFYTFPIETYEEPWAIQCDGWPEEFPVRKIVSQTLPTPEAEGYAVYDFPMWCGGPVTPGCEEVNARIAFKFVIYRTCDEPDFPGCWPTQPTRLISLIGQLSYVQPAAACYPNHCRVAIFEFLNFCDYSDYSWDYWPLGPLPITCQVWPPADPDPDWCYDTSLVGLGAAWGA